MFEALARVIPPPMYLSMPCIGVDISDTTLKYISFSPVLKGGTERTIEQWGELTIPTGIVNRGEVVDPVKLVAVLKEFKEKTKAEFVSVSLPEERAYMFETDIRRNIPYKEVRGLLEFRLEENVPIPSRDVYFDFSILPMPLDAKSVNISVAAYAKETVEAYYHACLEAGLRPISFEVEAQAMARAVVPAHAKGAVLVVDFGKTRSGIGIVHKGSLLYTSTIDIGGDHLSQALRKVLGDKPEAELTHIKNTQGLIRGADSSEIRDVLMSTVSIIRDEIVTRMQYWHTRNNHDDERRISSVVLCGGSANLRGIPEYFTETLSIPTTRGNVWENVFSLDTTVPPIDRFHSFGYAAAIGLALRNNV